MSKLALTLTIISAGFFLTVSAYTRLRSRSTNSIFLAELVGLSATLLFLHYALDFPTPIVTFGASPHLAILGAYVACVAGMSARYFFDFFDTPQPQRRFDLGTFLKPLFISPIVFLPLLGLIPQKPHLGPESLYVWFNAFQNGFFWSVLYEKAKSSLLTSPSNPQ